MGRMTLFQTAKLASNSGQRIAMAKKPSEAHLCMEGILRELFGYAFAEYQFSAPRKFRFDYAVYCNSFPASASLFGFKLAIEIDGGIWTGGRHTRGLGFQRDMEKLNLAAIEGWSVLRFTPKQVLSGEAEQTLKAWKKART